MARTPARCWIAANEGERFVRRPARAHVFALIAAFVAIVAVSAMWIVNLKLGPRLDGWTGGPMVIFVPLVLIILTAIWLVIRGVLHGRVLWRVSTVALATFIPTLIIVIVNCGPIACFTPGNERLMGWFVAGGMVGVSLIHHLVLNSFTPVSENGR